MTNSEKIKATFPFMKVGFITESQVGVYFVKNQHSATVFSLDWWNAEYKEPVIKNDLGVDLISRTEVLKLIYDYKENHSENRNEYPINYGTLLDIIRWVRNLPSVTLQEPLHGKCNQCKYYDGVHNVQGHAPCSYHKIGGVMWNWYCSQFESEVEK